MPCGPIPAEVFHQPQVRHRDMRVEVPHPLAGVGPMAREWVTMGRPWTSEGLDMKTSLGRAIRILVGVGLLASTCAHAPPATGNRDPDAPLDAEYPEINCKLYTTVDCREPASW